ncbi:MAG: cytochrome c oxidase subunit 3 family protein [Myxococcota bacterium]
MSEAVQTTQAQGAFPLADHFSNPKQQQEAAKLGMWLFLATEILLFGGLFVAYAIYRTQRPLLFVAASKQLDVSLGAFNTVVLLFSSLTVALAIRSAQLNRSKSTVFYLLTTLGCAVVFLLVKAHEYQHKIHEGLLPGQGFANTALPSPNEAHLFFGLYFSMTGLHAIHVLLGMGVLMWLAIRAWRGHFGAHYTVPLEMGGLYWHLVDVIWIYLFPLLYLVG